MGFDCISCGEREVFAFESHLYRNLCWDCHVKKGHPKDANMERYYNRPPCQANICVTDVQEVEK